MLSVAPSQNYAQLARINLGDGGFGTENYAPNISTTNSQNIILSTSSYERAQKVTLDGTSSGSGPSFRPNNQINLGRSDYKWKNGYFGGTLEAQSLSDGTTTKSMSEIVNIPAPPSADGEYNLHCSIVSGVPTYTWKAE